LGEEKGQNLPSMACPSLLRRICLPKDPKINTPELPVPHERTKPRTRASNHAACLLSEGITIGNTVINIIINDDEALHATVHAWIGFP